MKLYKLDAVRGFAAFYVIFHHVLPHSYRLFNINVGVLFRFGQEAVILFFLLSGFVINYSFELGKDKSFKSYFIKRFTRVYIPLIFILLLGFVIENIKTNGAEGIQFYQLLGNLFMLQDKSNLKPGVIVEPYMGNDPLWSLSYEWWFYMLYFPICSYLKSKESRHKIVFFSSIFAAAAYQFSPNFIFRLIMYFGMWWVGVYLSDLVLSKKKITLSTVKLPIINLAVIGGLLTVNAFYAIQKGSAVKLGIHPILEIRHFAFALLVLIGSVIWYQNKWRGFDLIFKPFLILAPISYVVYISHYYLITSATYLDFIPNIFIKYLLYLACTFAFSYYLELKIYPFLRKKFLGLAIAK